MLSEPVLGGPADLHQAVQFVRLIDSVGPLIDPWIGVQVLIGLVAKVLLPGFVQNWLECGGFTIGSPMGVL